jgi:hypothetical protein
MTDVEAKALALINEERAKTNNIPLSWVQVHYGATAKALCRTLEQHEAFKQEVSDAIVSEYLYAEYASERMQAFIIPKPKPDPLVEVIKAMQAEPTTYVTSEVYANRIHKKLDALGFEIREKGQ